MSTTETKWERMKRLSYERGRADGYNEAFGKWMRGDVGELEKYLWQGSENLRKKMLADWCRAIDSNTPIRGIVQTIYNAPPETAGQDGL